jgi:beta-mannosidase
MLNSIQGQKMSKLRPGSAGSLAACLLAVLSLLATAMPVAAAEIKKTDNRAIDLNTGWEFRQADDAKGMPDAAWLPAQIPGDVHLDLLRNKRIPDPYNRDNESKLQWIQDASWEYRTKVNGDADLLQHKRIEIVFAGLDAASDVYLNGQKILSANNMFREWRVDVKPLLQPGANELRVVFPSATKAAAAAVESDKWRAETLTPAKEYVRKAAYEYGWDWGPTFVTSGIWRPVTLQAWNEQRITNVYIQQLDISAEVAHLSAQIELNAAVEGRADLSLRMDAPDGTQVDFTRTAVVKPGLNHIVFPIEIAKPSLWFPAGYGAHPIYHFHARVSDEGKLQDEASAQTGLRSVVLRREPDQWGRSFEFVVNGIPVFAKGAALIPFDSFPDRVTEKQYRRILQSAVDANMNMLRSWGGGYYETDQFFNLCDELGIMIWQDFMFGNEWQPGTYAFKQNVEQEVEYQVKRLRNHPSIALWCGNNETEISWTWDRMKTPLEHAGNEGRRRMWQDYLTLFSGIIPRAVERLDPATPYWPSSPSADYEDVSETYQSGDMHDWAVWHGRAPFTEYETQDPRFMSEYGFQSFPEMKTIEAFTLPADRTSIFTPVMLAHQKNNEGNAIIHEYMLGTYGEPKDFQSYLYASQVLQAEGVKVGAEHLRRNRPRSMGSLYWQLNDCWPVASWSSIDYYGRWKALQYYARRFYSPILVSPHIEDGSLAVYVVSDDTLPIDATLELNIMTFYGKSIEKKVVSVRIDPLASKIYLKTPMEEIQGLSELQKIFAVARLTENGREISTNVVYFVPTMHIELPQAKIAPELEKTADGYRLKLSSPVLARSVYVDFGKYDVDLSDNYVNLLPAVPAEIMLHSEATLDQLRGALTIRSLGDTFSSKAVAPSSLTAVPANPDWR